MAPVWLLEPATPHAHVHRQAKRACAYKEQLPLSTARQAVRSRFTLNCSGTGSYLTEGQETQMGWCIQAAQQRPCLHATQ